MRRTHVRSAALSEQKLAEQIAKSGSTPAPTAAPTPAPAAMEVDSDAISAKTATEIKNKLLQKKKSKIVSLRAA